MADTILVDTDVLIDFLHGEPKAVSFFMQNEEKSSFATTVINSFELYVGAYHSTNREKNLTTVEELLSRFFVLELTNNDAKTAAGLSSDLQKEGLTVDFKDLLIGSVAVNKKYPLKTNNKNHFQKIPKLVLF